MLHAKDVFFPLVCNPRPPSLLSAVVKKIAEGGLFVLLNSFFVKNSCLALLNKFLIMIFSICENKSW